MLKNVDFITHQSLPCRLSTQICHCLFASLAYRMACISSPWTRFGYRERREGTEKGEGMKKDGERGSRKETHHHPPHRRPAHRGIPHSCQPWAFLHRLSSKAGCGQEEKAISQLWCLSGYFNFPPLLTSLQEPLAQSPPSCSQGRDAQKTNV